MSSFMKKASAALLAVVVALSLSVPVLSFADSSSGSAASDSAASAQPAGSGNSAESDAAASGDSADSSEDGTTPADDCVVTLEYYENVTYEEPGIPPNADGRYLLGTRQITGLQAGTQLNTWDYVLNLTGFFFFDAWPAKLTVSTNPDENIIQLFYFRYNNYSYTVNYYLLTGADLNADSWSEALAPEEVEFHKLGSEVIENQPYGELVEGDAYEYKLDGTYVVDSYPAEIRVGVEPDNNSLNVLYVPQSSKLPEDVVIPDEIVDAGTAGSPNAKPPSLPNDETFDKDGITSVLPNKKPASNDTNSTATDSADATDPGSEIVTIPGAGTMTKAEVDELFQDFVGAQSDEGIMEITDEMLANPVDPEVAKRIADAYTTGYENGTAAAEAQCAPSITDHIICIIIMIILAVLAIIGFALYGRDHRKLKQLQEQGQNPTPEPPIDPLE